LELTLHLQPQLEGKKRSKTKMKALEMWARLISVVTGLMFAWAVPQLRMHIEGFAHKAAGHINPYIEITFPEYGGERLERCEAYAAIKSYLSASASTRAKRLKASVKDTRSLVLSMDDNEEVVDEFEGVKLWWSCLIVSRNSTISLYPYSENRRYVLYNFYF